MTLASVTITSSAVLAAQRINDMRGQNFTADERGASISRIDPDGSVTTLALPIAPHNVQISATGRWLLAVRDAVEGKHGHGHGHAHGEGKLLVFDPKQYEHGAVAVIDTASREVMARIAVVRGPIQVHATSDGGQVYVANEGSTERPGDTVSVIDVARGEVVQTIRSGRGAHGLAPSSDGRFVSVTNILDNSVSVIATATGEVLATHAVGNGPNGITYFPPAN